MGRREEGARKTVFMNLMKISLIDSRTLPLEWAILIQIKNHLFWLQSGWHLSRLACCVSELALNTNFSESFDSFEFCLLYPEVLVFKRALFWEVFHTFPSKNGPKEGSVERSYLSLEKVKLKTAKSF